MISASDIIELLNDLDVVQSISIQRLHWLGHVVMDMDMEEDIPARRVYTEVDEEDDLVSVGRTKSCKPCHRLV